MNLAFIGLGAMGYPMAGHLIRAGHNVTVFNRSAAKADRWHREYGGATAPTPAQAAAAAEICFTCVGNDDDLRQVTLQEDGLIQGLARGGLLVDHTTTSVEVATELSKALAAHGVGFIDAPVSGGQAGAESGALTVMCGAQEETYLRAQPVMAAYAKRCQRMGDVGAGQLTKMVNQICIAGLLQSLAEAIHFGQNAGLDMAAVMDVIGNGAAQSWQMDNRASTMDKGEFDFGFAVDWMRKDLGICLEEARKNGSRLPVAALVDQFYASVQSKGGGRLDTSSLILALKDA